jgi:5-hydroxyisourate hydrolase-like protein (transthyretin family)
MRRVSFFLIGIVASGAFAQPPDAKPAAGRVEGRALNANTGAPLKKVTVRLKPSSESGVNEGHTVTVRSTTSDAEGRFSFDGVEAGAYVLSGHRNGYLDQGYGTRSPLIPGAPFKIDAGQNLTDVILKLAPQGMLFGKVTDEDGDPLPNVKVQVARLEYSGNRPSREISEVSSQDDGSYVIGNLVPGRYRVFAQLIEDEGQAAGTREAYVPTYYPNTIDPSAAAPVEVGPGAEVRGLNIRLTRIPVYRIRGRVVASDSGEPAANTSLRLQRVGEDAAITRGVTVGNDGVFQFHRLLPGDYWIQSSNDTFVIAIDRESGAAARPGRLVGRMPLHIGQEDLENVVVPLGSGSELRGAIRVEGQGSQIPGGLQLELVPVDGDLRNAVIAPVGRDGTFHFAGVMPDHYTVSVGGLQGGFYVRAIRLGNQDLTHLPLDLTSSNPAAVDVALSPDGAEVRGMVRGAAGEAVPGAAVRVWAADSTVYGATADETGAYRVNGLEPGEYRVFAWEEPDPALTADAAMRNAFGRYSASVKVVERAKETVDLKIISRETVETELAKVR